MARTQVKFEGKNPPSARLLVLAARFVRETIEG